MFHANAGLRSSELCLSRVHVVGGAVAGGGRQEEDVDLRCDGGQLVQAEGAIDRQRADVGRCRAIRKTEGHLHTRRSDQLSDAAEGHQLNHAAHSFHM